MGIDLSSVYDPSLITIPEISEEYVPDLRKFWRIKQTIRIRFGGMKMKIDGFNLLLQDFCSYCPYFSPEAEKINCSSFDELNRYVNNIRYTNRKKCSKIAENLEKRLENSR